MHSRRSLLLRAGAAWLVLAASSCATQANYLDHEGPRYCADYASHAQVSTLPWSPEGMDPIAQGPCTTVVPVEWEAAGSESDERETIKVVSYNLRYGKRVDAAIELLETTPELADADVILLQEMHASGVDRVARALGCGYVYYPASLRTSGLDFGNAVLTRGHLVEDEKVILPHANPFNRQRRIAVRTGVELGDHSLQTYSVHTETPFLRVRDRTGQVDAILDSVPPGSGPCLIAGDFNTMSRYSVRLFEKAFARSGFRSASANIGPTFGIGPFQFRTDHVFVRGLEVVGAGKVKGTGVSDHLPIWVELAWSPPTAPPVRQAVTAGIGEI